MKYGKAGVLAATLVEKELIDFKLNARQTIGYLTSNYFKYVSSFLCERNRDVG